MAFKGRTTSNYKPTTGKQLGAKKGGFSGKNPSGSGKLKGSKTNVVTRATQTGSNPRNSKTQMLNANRVQRAAGALGKGGLRQNMPKANIVTPRGKGNFSNNPLGGYQLLANSRSVPAGRGNLFNAATVNKQNVTRQRSANALKLPKGALTPKTGFGSFIK